MGNVVASRLKSRMQENNWSGRKLSQAANLSYNAVHYILSGKSKNTKFDIIRNIATILKVSPYYLLGHGSDEDYGVSTYSNSNNPGISQRRSLSTPAEDIPYNGELYRQIISVVENILSTKGVLTTQRLEYLTQRIYPQAQKSGKTGSDLKGYIEGVVDYALDL